MPKKQGSKNEKIIAENRKASFNYSIVETFEAGIILVGSEVKSLRKNHCSIGESFIGEGMGEKKSLDLFMFNANIPPYEEAKSFNHNPKAPRKLLLHKKEINKLVNAVRKKGMAIIPLRMFFNDMGRVKVKIGLAQGKNVVDKRATIKERDWERNKSRILKGFNKH
jgi:SsrA-binding protein